MQAESSQLTFSEEERELLLWALTEARDAEEILAAEDPAGIVGDENRRRSMELSALIFKVRAL